MKEESYSFIINRSLDRLFSLAFDMAYINGLYLDEVKDDYKNVKQTLDWNLSQMELWKKDGYELGFKDGEKAAATKREWYDIPSDEMTLEQARQAVKDLRMVIHRNGGIRYGIS